MSKPILAVFDNAAETAAALAELKREGFLDKSLTVMSSEPLSIEGTAHEARPSRIGLFGVAGGLVGGIAALLLTVVTSRRAGLVTGGMPIVAPWAFGIILFEMTALGAILFAVGRMIREAGLGKRRPRDSYDEKAIQEGRIVLLVDCSEVDGATARRILGDSIVPSESNSE